MVNRAAHRRQGIRESTPLDVGFAAAGFDVADGDLFYASEFGKIRILDPIELGGLFEISHLLDVQQKTTRVNHSLKIESTFRVLCRRVPMRN